MVIFPYLRIFLLHFTELLFELYKQGLLSFLWVDTAVLGEGGVLHHHTRLIVVDQVREKQHIATTGQLEVKYRQGNHTGGYTNQVILYSRNTLSVIPNIQYIQFMNTCNGQRHNKGTRHMTQNSRRNRKLGPFGGWGNERHC